MQLRFKVFNVERRTPPLYSPDSGDRFLATGKECVIQKANLDFFYDREKLVDPDSGAPLKQVPHPGYFALVFGEQGGYLWIAPGSHRVSLIDPSLLKAAGSVYDMRLQRFAPWSIIIVRGDVLHGGVGGNGSQNKMCLRYHMYIGREGVALADGINCYPGFKPRKDDKMLSEDDLLRTL